MSTETTAADTPPDLPDIAEDDRRLHQLGYPRVLRAQMNAFAQFAVPTSTISILTGPITVMIFAMTTGGPATMMWTWLVGGPLVLCVAVAMGRIASKYPVSAAVYFWTAQLARHKIYTSFTVAWLNFLGKLAGTAAAAYSCALFIGAFASVEWGFQVTAVRTLLIFAAILIGTGLLNALAVKAVGWLNTVSVIVHGVGAVALVVALLALPKHHQSVGWVFTHFVNNTGFHQKWLVVGLGVLTLIYTMTGIDSAGDMAEESKGAQINPSRAMLHSVLWSWAFGAVLIFAFMIAVQNYDGEVGSSFGVAPAQILVDAIPGWISTALIVWIIVAQLMCVMTCLTAMPRALWAMARDRGVPCSRWLYKVSARTKVPVNALIVAAVFSFVFGLPALKSYPLFTAITSVSGAALFVSYAVPIYLSIRPGTTFTPGPWNPRAPRLTGWTAIAYVAVATLLICLPTTRDFMHIDTFNWTPVALVVALIAVGAWYLMYARSRYDGPVNYGSPEELRAIEADLA